LGRCASGVSPRSCHASAVNLILLEAAEASDLVTLTGARARHVADVLRAIPGQRVRIGVIDGPLGTGIVEHLGRDDVRLRCTFEETAPPLPAVDLLLALPRPKVMRRLWAQLAALGVGRILLTNAERVERPYFDTHVLAPEVYRPLLVEGLQQARDTRLPRVSIHRRFRVLVEDELDAPAGNARRVMAHPGIPTRVAEALDAGPANRVLLAIGPEGGWNDFERRLLEEHGFRGVGLGPRTLRTDTASVALLALVHDALRSRTMGGRIPPVTP
jgi:RsmE family RNA methyltransferase